MPKYCRLEYCFYVVKKPSDPSHRSAENWVLHGFGRHVVRTGTVPNLGLADWELELWTGSDMGSLVSDLEFGLETGPVTGLTDQNWLRTWSKLGLTNPEFELKTGPCMG